MLFAPALTALLLAAFASPALARNAYVVNSGSDNVSVIDTDTNQVFGRPDRGRGRVRDIAITPDGRRLVADGETKRLGDRHPDQPGGRSPITVGKGPVGIAITPDGKFAYVTNASSDSVSVIDTQTNQVVGSPITVGDGLADRDHPRRQACLRRLHGEESVSVIDTQTNQVVGSPIPVGEGTDRDRDNPRRQVRLCRPTPNQATSR